MTNSRNDVKNKDVGRIRLSETANAWVGEFCKSRPPKGIYSLDRISLNITSPSMDESLRDLWR